MTVSIGQGWSIGSGWNIGGSEPTLMLNLDAATYSGSGDWIDSVGGLHFTLNGSPTYSAVTGGGSFLFVPSSGQWANSSTSLSNMSTWTVEAWHYYTGNNAGVDPGAIAACIVTETYTGTPNAINYSLGNDFSAGGTTDLQAGFWNGTWRTTGTGITLTTNTWNQIVGTYDGATIKLYINNSMVSSTSYSGTPTSSGLGIRLMRRWDNADYWGGRLAIVKIYNGDIGASGVSSSWSTNKARFGL